MVNRYDPRGRYPFLFINGQYALTGPAGYSPGSSTRWHSIRCTSN